MVIFVENVKEKKRKKRIVKERILKMKIWLVRSCSGHTDKAFKTKKEAVAYAKKTGLDHWHKGETDGCFDGIEGIEIENA